MAGKKLSAAPDSAAVKAYGITAGASLVGIASAEAFQAAPQGFHPVDVLPGCRSVIVLAVPFPKEALTDASLEYIDVRNETNARVNGIAKAVAKQIKASGCQVKALNGMGGKWVDGRQIGHISLKHAAELAGLGVITRNYLLTNAQYGNLLWFSAVLTDLALTPDEKATGFDCGDCSLCVDGCPSSALDVPGNFGRKKCDGHCFRMEERKWKIRCFQCRAICPNRFGKKNVQEDFG